MAKGIGRQRASYFDRAAVIAAVGKARAKILSRVGAYVRRTAQTSIRPITRYRSEADMPAHLRESYSRWQRAAQRREDPPTKRPKKPYRHSKPGEPPKSITGTLRRNIEFAYDGASRSVVIGAAKIQDGHVPEVLEHGGAVTVKRAKQGTATLHYAARPFMQPAFAKELPKAADLWKNAVRGG